MVDRSGIESLLKDDPDIETALEEVLHVDRNHERWTFDDIPLETGTFGELVSRGIVEEHGEGYRLSQPEVVQSVLDGTAQNDSASDLNIGFDSVTAILPEELDTTTTAAVVAVLGILALSRSYPYDVIYRGQAVVFSGNDPYFYQFWIEKVVAQSSGSVDLSVLLSLPDIVSNGEPLMIVTIWFFATLFGGTRAAVSHVMAWYPVVSSVLSGLLAYLIAIRVTGDKRVGVASVLFFAIIPGHAFRTTVGFADHHAFDYLWLALTAFSLILLLELTRDENTTQRRVVGAGGLLAISITGQTLAWEAGPLLVIPVAIVVLALAVLDFEMGNNPIEQNAPLLGSIGVSAFLVGLSHIILGWHTLLVASTPILLFLGSSGVFAVTTAVERLGGKLRHVLGIVGFGGILGVAFLLVLQVTGSVSVLGQFDALAGTNTIGEAKGIFAVGWSGILLFYGLILVFALPTMVWALRKAKQGDVDWVVVTVYGWYLFALSAIQVRFVGEFALFGAFFTGCGFVLFLSHLEVIRPFGANSGRTRTITVPSGRTLGILAIFFLLIASFGAVNVDRTNSMVATGEETYSTAMFLNETVESGHQNDPFVTSYWGENRVYNYFLDGNASQYTYSQEYHERLLILTDGPKVYHWFKYRVTFLVTKTPGIRLPERTLQYRLHQLYGSSTGGTEGTGHFRALYSSDTGAKKAFQLVPGAVLEGTAQANESVVAVTDVTIPNAEFTYRRQTQANEAGRYTIAVSQPGTYTITNANTSRQVTVSETAVQNGDRIVIGNDTSVCSTRAKALQAGMSLCGASPVNDIVGKPPENLTALPVSQ